MSVEFFEGNDLVEPYHAVWIKYFTMDCELRPLKTNQKTEVDFFLEGFNYSPFSLSTVKKEISACKTSEDVSHKLAQIFNFSDYLVLNSCILAQICTTTHSIKTENEGVVPQAVFRGLIVFSYLLPDAILCHLCKANFPLFQDQYWQVAQYTIEYLFLCNDQNILKDLCKVFEQIKSCLLKSKQIFNLPKTDPIYIFFKKFIEIIIPFFHSFFSSGIWTFFDFCLDALSLWAQCRNEIDHYDPFIEVSTIFFQTVSSFIKELPQQISNKLSIFSSCFISRYCSPHTAPNTNDVSFCLTCFTIISQSNSLTRNNNSILASRALLTFLCWSLNKEDLEGELTNIQPLEVKKEPLIPQETDIYFATHTLFTAFFVKKLKTEGILSSIYQAIIAFFSSVLPITSVCLEGFEDLPDFNEETYMPAMIIILSALTNIYSIRFSDSLLNFISMILTSPHFVKKTDVVLDSLSLKYQMCVLNFCMQIASSGLKQRMSVLKLFASIIDDKNFDVLSYFFPIVRSLVVVEREVSCIPAFIESGLLEVIHPMMSSKEYVQQIDEFAALCQIFAAVDPVSIFSSFILLPMMTELVTNPRYQSIIIQGYKCGFEISKLLPFETAANIIHTMMSQISAIFISSLADTSLLDAATHLLEQYNASVPTFPKKFMKSYENDSFFDCAAKTAAELHDSHFTLILLKALTTFCIKYPEFIEQLNSKSSLIYSNLHKAFKGIKPLTQDLINAVLSLACNSETTMDNCSNKTIQNREAIKLILNIVDGTEFEKSTIYAIIDLCKTSSSNCFECFHCDLIRYCLTKCDNSELLPQAIGLYSTISSVFFSPLSMNETFRALYFGETRSVKQQAILDCLINMISEGNPSPVSSFFHLNGFSDGIVGPGIDSEMLKLPWAFATTLRMDRAFSSTAPLVAFIEPKGSLSIVFAENSELKIIRKEGEQCTTATMKYRFRKQIWYHIIISYNESTVTLYVNEQKAESVHFNIDISGQAFMRFGSTENMFLAGDLGPTYLFCTDDIKEVFSEFSKSLHSFGKLKNAVISLHPCLVQQGEINNVITLPQASVLQELNQEMFSVNQKPVIVGTAVPYCTTINDVLKLDGSFFGFLPLFSTINREYVGDEEDHTLRSLIITLRLLLSISLETQMFFESIGGFKLLAGFFAEIKPYLFTPVIATELSEIFKVLVVDSLRSQMVEYIWLNFSLWSRMAFEYQETFYQSALPCVYKIDCSTQGKAFQFDSYDFLLFQCQTPLLTKPVSNEANENAQVVDDVSNFIVNELLEEEQRDAIKSYQWSNFSEIFRKGISSSSFLIIYMVLAFHTDTHIRISAFSIFEKYLGEQKQEVIIAITILGGYECMIPLMASDDVMIQTHVLLCLYLILNLERAGLYHCETSLDTTMLKIISVWNHNIPSVEEICKLTMFYSMDARDSSSGKRVIEYPQFLLLFIEALQYVDRTNEKTNENITEMINDLKNSLLCSGKLPVKDHLIWMFYMFVFFNNCYDDVLTQENMNELIEIISSLLSVDFDMSKINLFSVFAITLSLVTDFNFMSIFEKATARTADKLITGKWANSSTNRVTGEGLCELAQLLTIISLYDMTFDTGTLGAKEQTSLKKFSQEKVQEIRKILYDSAKEFNINQDFQFTYIQDDGPRKPSEFKYQLCKVFLSICSSKCELNVQITSTLSMKPIELFSFIMAKIMIESKNQLSGDEDLIEFMNLFFVSYDSRASTINDETRKRIAAYVVYGSAQHGTQTLQEMINDKFKSLVSEQDAQLIYQCTEEEFKKGATQHQIDYKPLFVSIRTKIGQEMHISNETGDDSLNSTNHNSYASYIKAYQKKRLLVEHHNHKLAASFVREATSNGGPLSKELTTQKWKVTTSFDRSMRNIFMKINRNFNDHHEASMLRDSIKMDKSEQPIIVPFKRILDQDLSFAASHGNESIRGKVSFTGTLLTISSRFDGKVILNMDNVVFEGKQITDVFGNPVNGEMVQHKYIEIPLSSIEFVFLRRHLHEQLGCEIFTNQNKSYLFLFSVEERKNAFLEALQKAYDENRAYHKTKSSGKGQGGSKSTRRRSSSPPPVSQSDSSNSFDFFDVLRICCGGIIQNHTPVELVAKTKITEQWQQKNISTFTYLMYLNILGGRSLNNLSQYPVFPWVLNCYDSDKLDLDDPSCYRDFAKPIAAMNESRLEHLKALSDEIDDPLQKCLCRSHYSNPASVIGYMIREEPFSTLHIILQEGRYDHADRLFSSIGGAWTSVIGSSNDFRELIPEFFCTHHFLCNDNKFDLGVLLDGERVDDVFLPPWAHSAYEFISLHRKALESDYVSKHINDWIDLIFGINRRSKERNNVFHLFSYSDLVMQLKQRNNGEGIDESTLALAKHHCANFGCCPDALFTSPHPRRAIISASNSSGSLQSASNFPASSSSQPNLITKIPHAGRKQPSSEQLVQMQFDEKILFMGSGFILTTNELINIHSGKRFKINTTLYPPQRYVLCELIPKLSVFITILQGSSFATVTKFISNGAQSFVCTELATLAHKGSVILCAANIDNEYLATGGSDCVINIFSMRTWEPVATLPFHSLPITCISGNSTLGIIVSIDEGNQVFCSSIKTRRFIHAFTIDCTETSEHKVAVLDSGLIAVSSSDISKMSKLDIYDLRGSLLKTISLDTSIGIGGSKSLNINSSVVRIISIPTNYWIPYICVTTKSKHVVVIDGCSLEPIKTFVESIIPELVAAPTNVKFDSRSLYVIKSNRTLRVLNF